LELRHLRYCIAVAEEGSFTRAARRLRLAQQAVSRQIADLERELGVKLFERGARGARLTPAGSVFVEDARGALGQTERAAQRARAQSTHGKLCVAYSYLTPSHFIQVGEAIARFHQSRPDLALDVRHLSTGAQNAALKDGSVDVAFEYLPAQETGEIVSELFCDDPMVGVLLPAAHQLATRERLWLKDLDTLPLLMLAREVNPVAYDSLMGELSDRGLSPELAIVQVVGVPAVSMVAQGSCWKLASLSMSEEAKEEPDVAFRRVADPPLPFGLWLRRRRQAVSQLGQQFAALCREISTGLARSSGVIISMCVIQEIWLIIMPQTGYF
jgi:LysR family transcriptional regulator, hca operon transcriptional activator